MRVRWTHPQKGSLTVSSKVFVGNLEFSTTKDQLETLFAEAGSVLDVFLPSDRATGRPRGFAFVEFATDEEAQAAIKKFDGYELGGRNLRVNPAEARAGGPPRWFPAGRRLWRWLPVRGRLRLGWRRPESLRRRRGRQVEGEPPQPAGEEALALTTG
jgi:RNA recognition motif-containing protein